MTLSRVTERAKEVAKEPSRAWRNKWRAVGRFFNGDKLRLPGDVYWGARTWPSKEMAEQGAAISQADPNRASGCGEAIYLGAFPTGPA